VDHLWWLGIRCRQPTDIDKITDIDQEITSVSHTLFKQSSPPEAGIACHPDFLPISIQQHCLQCFDTVGWVAGRASKKLSGGVLAWLSVWNNNNNDRLTAFDPGQPR